MSGPTKFLTACAATAMSICAALIAWLMGGGPTSTTLVWYGALGMLVQVIVVQSEWPRDENGAFLSIDDARDLPKPPRGSIASFIAGVAVYGVYVSLVVGVLAKCTGN